VGASEAGGGRCGGGCQPFCKIGNDGDAGFSLGEIAARGAQCRRGLEQHVGVSGDEDHAPIAQLAEEVFELVTDALDRRGADGRRRTLEAVGAAEEPVDDGDALRLVGRGFQLLEVGVEIAQTLVELFEEERLQARREIAHRHYVTAPRNNVRRRWPSPSRSRAACSA
jgi:hypothetical protein